MPEIIDDSYGAYVEAKMMLARFTPILPHDSCGINFASGVEFEKFDSEIQAICPSCGGGFVFNLLTPPGW